MDTGQAIAMRLPRVHVEPERAPSPPGTVQTRDHVDASQFAEPNVQAGFGNRRKVRNRPQDGRQECLWMIRPDPVPELEERAKSWRAEEDTDVGAMQAA
jgi:hypothetical protein